MIPSLYTRACSAGILQSTCYFSAHDCDDLRGPHILNPSPPTVLPVPNIPTINPPTSIFNIHDPTPPVVPANALPPRRANGTETQDEACGEAGRQAMRQKDLLSRQSVAGKRRTWTWIRVLPNPILVPGISVPRARFLQSTPTLLGEGPCLVRLA